MKKIILSVALVAAFMSGCKKKDDPAPTKTTAEYLTAHSWKTSGAVSDVAIDADDNSSTPNTTDLWGQGYDDCEKDNVISLSSDGTGTFTDAGTPCSGNTVQNFTWTLANNNTQLVITPAGSTSYTQTVTIVSIDDNTFVITLPADTDANNVSYIEKDTYSKY